ncbi:MAG: CooT family nickel-binding protein [Candidatus Helarchaeota archaeon]
MCEFKVKLNSENQLKDVCNEIIYANVDENIILRDILGSTNIVESAIITEVSVTSARMTLFYSPILKNILKFLKLQKKCYEEKLLDQKIVDLWNEIKEEGDAFVNSLKKKFGK